MKQPEIRKLLQKNIRNITPDLENLLTQVCAHAGYFSSDIIELCEEIDTHEHNAYIRGKRGEDYGKKQC